MARRVAIIGGGWYGCHIASSLMALGFSVRLFEQNHQLMHEASGNNQFRLHLGFHYPRHAGTRIQSRDGFSRFLERYSDLSRPIKNNIYVVPKQTSLIDFETYKLIMTATGIPYHSIEECDIELRDVDGMMRVDERVILLEKARHYFSNHLEHILNMSTKVSSITNSDNYASVNGDRFDYVIDATWGHCSAVPIPTYFEPTLLLYFEAEASLPALTFVDGPLYSIYPTEVDTIYTLSSVPHTPLGRYKTSEEARAACAAIDSSLVEARLSAMVQQVRCNVPQFCDQYKFVGPQISIKTKPIGNTDDRSCYVVRNGRLFSVMSGKIDTIFFATERILSMMELENDSAPEDVPSSLIENIKSKVAQMGIRV